MNGEPRFLQLPKGPSPLLREFAGTVFLVFLATWVGLPAFFAPPVEPIHMRPLALPHQSCKDWEAIINGRSRLSKFWASVFTDAGTITETCTQLGLADANPFENARKYIRSGEGMAALDPAKSECGSDEARSGAERYYLIVCSPNPNTFNALSWTHEAWHLALGHTAIRHTVIRVIYVVPEPFSSYTKAALNAFLDTAYVWPALVLGAQGSAWFRTSALLVWFLLRCRHLRRGMGLRGTSRLQRIWTPQGDQ
jgi:hypothetical protein